MINLDTFIDSLKAKYTNVTYDNIQLLTITKDGIDYFINLPKDEIEEELSFLTKVVNDCTIIDNKLQFILFSDDTNIQDLALEAMYTGTIKKFKDNIQYPILIRNFDLLKIDFTKNNYTLDELISDNLYICDIKIPNSNISKEQLMIIVDSIILDVLYSKSIRFNFYKKLVNINDEVVTYKILDHINTIAYKDIVPLQYFILAETIKYSNFKYLEYYHVIEYFFVMFSKKRISEIMKQLITDTFVKNKNLDDDYLFEIYRSFLNPHRIRKNEFSEVDQLLELFKSINFDTLSEALSAINFDISKLSSAIFGINETKIDLNKCTKKASGKLKLDTAIDQDEKLVFLSKLATRIYKIRNYIVHTKKGELSIDVFYPNSDNLSKLREDILLIREISRILLIQSSFEF
ncbi:hypothetical protein [Aliarcobacter cryaerophilus]|uniref:hypothetical protein n=2 Tax=Aliarcobacter cryaerophilus TaxID=28198 RepID=UPI003DA5E13E